MSASTAPRTTRSASKKTRDAEDLRRSTLISNAQATATPQQEEEDEEEEEDATAVTQNPDLTRHDASSGRNPFWHIGDTKIDLREELTDESRAAIEGLIERTRKTIRRSAPAWECKRNNHTQGFKRGIHGLLCSPRTKYLPMTEVRSKAAFKIRMFIGFDGEERKTKWMTWAEALAFEQREKEIGSWESSDEETGAEEDKDEQDEVEQDEDAEAAEDDNATEGPGTRKAPSSPDISTRAGKRRRGGA